MQGHSWTEPSMNLGEVTISENDVASYCVKSRLKHDLFPMSVLELFCLQTENVTAIHPDNRWSYIWWSFRHSSDISEIFSNFWVVSIERVDHSRGSIRRFLVDKINRLDNKSEVEEWNIKSPLRKSFGGWGDADHPVSSRQDILWGSIFASATS